MKRIIALILCLLLVFQLTACSAGGETLFSQLFGDWLEDNGYDVTVTPTTTGVTVSVTPPTGTTVTPTTAMSTTAKPTTAKPTTAKPTTAKPTTAKPTTAKPTAAKPTTAKPTTAKPTTVKPTTAAPTTAAPTTVAPTTAAPTTVAPTTAAPTTAAPTTAAPTTAAPTTAAPTTAAPTTAAPTTAAPTTAAPTTAAPTTAAPTTAAPTTAAPTTTPVYGTHTKLPYTQRYLYNQLTEQEKDWYRRIDAAVQNLEIEVETGANMAENERYYIYFVYLHDNPEHFYLGNTIGTYVSGNSGGLILSYSDGQNNVYYRNDGKMPKMTDTIRANIRARKAAFDAEVQRIIATIPVNISDAEKERMLYDRLLVDLHYNVDAVNNQLWDGVAEPNWTAYGGIINKTGVCEAYSEAFQTLCFAVGINCTIVVGSVEAGGHQWNAVELEGQWYACDLTYDDPVGCPANTAYSHIYFNLTSQRMKNLGHLTTDSRFPGPTCTGTKYGYHYFQ